jgi:hypothetical protein
MVTFVEEKAPPRPPCDSNYLFEPKLQMYNRYCDENLLHKRNNNNNIEIENKTLFLRIALLVKRTYNYSLSKRKLIATTKCKV